MLGRSVMMAAAWPTPLAYRSSAESNNNTTVAKPAGVAVGDLVVLVVQTGLNTTISTSGGSVWTMNSSADGRLYYKVLDATDVANTWLSSEAGMYGLAVAYGNGGTLIASVSVRSWANAGPSVTSLAVPGFALSGGGKPRLVIAGMGGTNVGAAPTPPANFTTRATDPTYASGFADAQQAYTGQTVTWTGLTSDPSSSFSGWLLEVH